MLDDGGKDAIWIQESESAKGQGHSGLMVQDENDNWFYFYWGPVAEDAPIVDLIFGVPNGSYFEPIETYGADLTQTSQVIDILKSAENSYTQSSKRADKITETYYFVGDYTATFNKAKEYSKSGEEYKLITNNCAQKTINAFYDSDPRFSQVAYGFVNYCHPNSAASKVAMMPSKQGKTPWRLILHNLIFE